MEATNTPKKKNALMVVLVILVVAVAAVFFLLFSTVKDAMENAQFSDAGLSEGGGERDARVAAMLEQYDRVVAATSADVTWGDYLIELDAFIAALEGVYEIDANATLAGGLEAFRHAQAAYEAGVKLDEPDAPIDEAKIEEAGVFIEQGQEAVNAYLSEIGYQ